jgi:SAM-dependent methyltransferase
MVDPGLKNCPVCGSPAMTQIYHSGTRTSLSSLCQILPGPKIVSSCAACGHLAGNRLADADSFYESDYQILLDDEDEDQIYEIRGDDIVTRTDHQLAVLLDKLAPGVDHDVLDYGCAKAAMARKLMAARPGARMHLFDVSRMYEPFWDRIVEKPRQAVRETPPEWNGRFDVVMSFFAFEHVADPRAAMAHVAKLLKPGGQFYMVVPDVFGNAADFIVVDHVNHFTRTSVARLLDDAGFGDAEIDNTSHRGALVVTARKHGATPADPGDAAERALIRTRADELAAFWSKAADAVRGREPEARESGRSAIYGSGFYGAFIHAHLNHPSAVSCFLDQSRWRQGKSLFDVPIVAPDQLPEDVGTVYAGLNPLIARGIMQAQPWFARPGLGIVYLR